VTLKTGVMMLKSFAFKGILHLFGEIGSFYNSPTTVTVGFYHFRIHSENFLVFRRISVIHSENFLVFRRISVTRQ